MKNWCKKRDNEIYRYAAKGEHWTPYRPFYSWEEHVGAFRCGTMPKPRKCTRQSTHVSYSTALDGLAGRVVVCVHCLARIQGLVLPARTLNAINKKLIQLSDIENKPSNRNTLTNLRKIYG